MTTTMNIRMDERVKSDLDDIATAIGLSSSAVVNVLVKRFVAERGFPFEVKAPAPTEEEFAAEMERRYAEVVAGKYVTHELIEV